MQPKLPHQYQSKFQFEYSLLHAVNRDINRYSKEDLISILNSKLKNLYDLIPKKIIYEGAFLACKGGGDFREMEKYIIKWAET